jgi:hypothetical protein
MIDKRDGETKKAVKQQDYFRQSRPGNQPKDETGKGGQKGK